MNLIRALVVENDTIWQDIIRNALERYDCAVDVAGSYQDALHRLERDRFDMVTLDMALNDREEQAGMKVATSSGWLLLVSFLRQQVTHGSIYVVSASFDKKDVRRAFQLKNYGVRDYLSKDDFEPEIVQEWVAEVRSLKTRAPEPAPADVFAGYERGLRHLFKLIEREHTRYAELLVFQQRLTENITLARLHGDTESLRADRSLVIKALNDLTLAELQIAFISLCS